VSLPHQFAATSDTYKVLDFALGALRARLAATP